MKVIVLQENLIKALAAAIRIIATKAQMPILGHIKLDANKQGFIVSSTDLEIGLRLQIGAKIETPGSVAVPARVLTELISNCGSGNLTLKVEKEELQILGIGIKAKLSGMSSEEFPSLPEFKEPATIQIPSEQLIEAINKVSFAAATDDTRPVLTAIQMKSKKGKLELAATDGFRLSWLSLPNKTTEFLKDETKWLIPARALVEVSRLIEPSVENIQLGLTDKNTQVIFKIGDTELVSRLVSGDFPDFRKIMPDSGDTVVEMDRRELLRAMRLASIFARESANIVKFNISQNNLTITANAPQVGNQESIVDAKVDGPKTRIAFNYRYVLDYLNAGTSPSVKLLITSSLGPGLWLETPSSQAKSDNFLHYKHVIMPVRVETDNK